MEFTRFGFVGGLCFTLGLALLFFFTDIVGWHYMWSLVAALVIVNIIGWFLNRIWTFGSNCPQIKTEFARYLSVNSGGAAITMVLMGILVSGFGLHYLFAGVLVGAGMTLFNYVVHRRWSFKIGKSSDQHRS